MEPSRRFNPPELAIDLDRAITSFDRIIGSLAKVKLYVHARVYFDVVEPACWMTDEGLAIFFSMLPPDESSEEWPDGPKPEDYAVEDEVMIVTFAEAMRTCWLYQSLLVIRLRNRHEIIWDARRLRPHFDALTRLKWGWGTVGETELRVHQNAVELSLVDACLAFQKLAIQSFGQISSD
jgi:hypothetical protein